MLIFKCRSMYFCNCICSWLMEERKIIYVINSISIIAWAGDCNLSTSITGNRESSFPIFFKRNTASHRDIHPTTKRVIQISSYRLILWTACKCNSTYEGIVTILICKFCCAHRICRIGTCSYFKSISIKRFKMVYTFVLPFPVKNKTIPIFEDKFIIQFKVIFSPSHSIVVSIAATLLVGVIIYKE